VHAGESCLKVFGTPGLDGLRLVEHGSDGALGVTSGDLVTVVSRGIREIQQYLRAFNRLSNLLRQLAQNSNTLDVSSLPQAARKCPSYDFNFANEFGAAARYRLPRRRLLGVTHLIGSEIRQAKHRRKRRDCGAPIAKKLPRREHHRPLYLVRLLAVQIVPPYDLTLTERQAMESDFEHPCEMGLALGGGNAGAEQFHGRALGDARGIP
jgi:hypothetical protein